MNTLGFNDSCEKVNLNGDHGFQMIDRLALTWLEVSIHSGGGKKYSTCEHAIHV